MSNSAWRIQRPAWCAGVVRHRTMARVLAAAGRAELLQRPPIEYAAAVGLAVESQGTGFWRVLACFRTAAAAAAERARPGNEICLASFCLGLGNKPHSPAGS